MRQRTLALALVLVAGSACETAAPPIGDSSSGAQAVRPARNDEVATTTTTAAACATLRDVATADLVALDGDVLYHLDEPEGLGITDVTDPDRPREIARVAAIGTPIALYLRPPHAWIAYVDWDARTRRSPGASTVIRALDIRRPEQPRVLGEATRPGIAAGTALVGGVMVVLSGSGERAVATSFRLDGDRLVTGGDLPLQGKAAALAASPAGLAAITTSDRGVRVSWIDLPIDRPGAMVARGDRLVDGGFPAWERDVVSAEEGQSVRFLTCASTACKPDDDAFVRVVDFSGGAADVRASMPIGIARGVPVARFVDDWLYIGDGSQLRIVKLHPTPRVVGTTHLAGNVAALRAHGQHLVAVGTVGTPSTRVRVVLEDVDIRSPGAPRVRGAAMFGDDWTWSRAADDDRAISIDPSSDLVAIPFATWRARGGRYATGAQLVALREGPPALRDALPADGHVERAVFVRGRLLAVGGGTVTTLERRGAPEGAELNVR